MSGSIEIGVCDLCHEQAKLVRRYYHYALNCDCCLGGKHFELIRYCEDCKPTAPNRIRIVLDGVMPYDKEGDQ